LIWNVRIVINANSKKLFNKGYFYQKCEFIVVKRKHQIEKKLLGWNNNFRRRLSHGNKSREEFYFSMMDIKQKSIKGLIKKLQNLTRKKSQTLPSV